MCVGGWMGVDVWRGRERQIEMGVLRMYHYSISAVFLKL